MDLCPRGYDRHGNIHGRTNTASAWMRRSSEVEMQILQDAYMEVSGRQRRELVVEQISAITSM